MEPVIVSSVSGSDSYGMENYSPAMAQHPPPPEQQPLTVTTTVVSHQSNNSMVKSNAFYWEVVCEAFSEVGATPDKTLYLRLRYSNSEPHKFECCCMGNLSQKYSALKDLSNHILNNHCATTKMCLLCISDKSGCNVSFTNAMDVSHHATHQHYLSLNMYYMCDECQLVLPGVQALKYHLTYNHNDEFDIELVSKFRCFPCFLCLMPFKSQGLRKNHLEKKHGVFIENEIDNLRKKSEIQTGSTLEEIQQCLQLTRDFLQSNKLAQDILSQCVEDGSNNLTEKLKHQGSQTNRYVYTTKDLPIMWPINEMPASTCNQNLVSSVIGNCQVSSRVPEGLEEPTDKGVVSDIGREELQNQMEMDSSSDTSTQSSTCLPLHFTPIENEKKADNSLKISVDLQPETRMDVDSQPDDGNKIEENRIRDGIMKIHDPDSPPQTSTSMEKDNKTENDQTEMDLTELDFQAFNLADPGLVYHVEDTINQDANVENHHQGPFKIQDVIITTLHPDSPPQTSTSIENENKTENDPIDMDLIELDLQAINLTDPSLVYHVEDTIVHGANVENHHELPPGPRLTKGRGRPMKKKSKKCFTKKLPDLINPPFGFSNQSSAFLVQVQSSKPVLKTSFRAITPEPVLVDKTSSEELNLDAYKYNNMENMLLGSNEKTLVGDAGIPLMRLDPISTQEAETELLTGTDGANDLQEMNDSGTENSDSPDFSNNQIGENSDQFHSQDRFNEMDNTQSVDGGHWDTVTTNNNTTTFFKEPNFDEMFKRYPLVSLYDIFG